MKHTLDIEGMGCSHCVQAVKDALSGIAGMTVTNVEIGQAEIELPDGTLLDRTQIAAVLDEEGYALMEG